MLEYGIGNTPLIKLPSINGNKLFIKMETKNYLGSVKSRTGYALINGLNIPRERIVIESTSGNLGLALDFFCKEAGRPLLCLLDESILPAKLDHFVSRGIRYKFVPTESGLDGRASRMRHAESLAADGSHHWLNQCDNENGVRIHKETTGPEIYKQTSGAVTCVFCSVGSGGTVSGIGEFFKGLGSAVKVIGVEPYGSTIFHDDVVPYVNAGAGLSGKPGNIERHADVIHSAYAIRDEDSIEKFRVLNNELKLDVGLTTGMIYAAAESFCGDARGETIVLVAADGMEYYNEFL